MDKEKAKEALNKIMDCVEHDACDEERCEYFNSFEELQAVLACVEEMEAYRAEPAEAEMLVVMNDGKGLYLKGVDSIMLLAHKDYGITYCGAFE